MIANIKSIINIIIYLYMVFFTLIAYNCDAENRKINPPVTLEDNKITGNVEHVIHNDMFTYAKIKTENKTVWVAAPKQELIAGQRVEFSATMPMRDFYSKNLKRKFPLIYFVKGFYAKNNTATKPFSRIKTKPTELKVGDRLGKVPLDSLNGQSNSFMKYKGKPLIINVWASWCGPCKREMSSLEQLSHWNNGENFSVIGVSTDDYRSKALAFIKQTEITFENFIDHKLLLENMLGASRIPLTILVDAEGRILKKVSGARKWDSPEMIAGIIAVFEIKTDSKVSVDSGQ